MKISEQKLLLHAYYECLYERLRTGRNGLDPRVDKYLTREIAIRDFGPFSHYTYQAYRQNCLDLLDERIETYNPIGIQYTYEQRYSSFPAAVSSEGPWPGVREEFAYLLESIQRRARLDMDDQQLTQAAEELIAHFGAYPDRSIILVYETSPDPVKLPDYVVAMAIEEVIG